MKKNKLRIKKSLVILLAVVLIILNIDSPTFSWFPRDEEQSGSFLKYDVTSSAGIKAYYNETEDNASISIETFEMNESGLYTQQVFEREFIAPSSVEAEYQLDGGARKSYKTTITSSYGGADHYVSLYIDKLIPRTTGKLCLGVNSPVCGYKVFSETKTDLSDDKGTKRIYFQTKAAPNWSDIKQNNSGLEVVWWTGSNASVTEAYKNREYLTYIKHDASEGYTYYADIGANANYLYFHIVGQNESAGYITQIFPDLLTTQNCTALTSKIFYAQTSNSSGDGYAYNGYGNLDVGISQVNGANDIRQYNSILIPKGKTIEVPLTQNNDCIYNEISYASTNTNVFTVSSSGRITAKAAGGAKLKTTLNGVYGDKIVLYTNVVVTDTEYDDVPIVTNYFLPSGESIDIYWFIQNDSTSSMTYDMSGVYIGS